MLASTLAERPLLTLFASVLVACASVVAVRRHPPGQQAQAGGCLVWFLVVLALTLRTPSLRAPMAGRVALNPFADITSDMAGREAVANVLLFLPFGLLAGLRRPPLSRRAVVLIAMVISAAIELAQLAMADGRLASSRDVLLNAGGALFGCQLVAHGRAHPRPDVAGTRAGVATATVSRPKREAARWGSTPNRRTEEG